jgi:pimeloyl-ACP methyl ester carboxylesterase
MDNFKDSDKVLFIPGWFDSGSFYSYRRHADIWEKNIDLEQDFHADIIIAHSLGSAAALYNFNIHKQGKLVLINPVVSRKNLLIRWLQSMSHELPDNFWQRFYLLFFLAPAVIKAWKLLRLPSRQIIKSIPSDKLLLVYGEKDRYLGERDLIDSALLSEVAIIELKGAGHNYGTIIDQALPGLISKYLC